MKRLHVHVHVDDLEKSIGFYSLIFANAPTLRKDDYAKWQLDDPAVNFAISNTCGRSSGLNHLGLQTDGPDELEDIHARLKTARELTLDQKAARCCYAVSDKHWVTDPDGIVWEMFHTMSKTEVYGEDRVADAQPPNSEAASKDQCESACGCAPQQPGLTNRHAEGAG